MIRPSLMTLAALTVWLCCSPAHGIDFVTQDRFKSETGGYKDYPFRVLFQKLAQSTGAEKKEIRTAIIAKQVFDRKMQQRVAAGTVSYTRTYGVVREIDEDRLVLWDPQGETQRIFHTGLLAIPMVNPEHHEVSVFNVSRFAVVVDSMDERVYRIEIAFPLAPPQDLQLSREGSQNLLQWSVPSTSPEPVGYRVQVSGELFASVGTRAIRIPRKPDRADEYRVRAVYRHGPVLLESAPSPTLFDSATATELAEKKQADQAYELMLTALNPASWESGKRILAENLDLFSARLDERRQAVVLGLTRFFADIDEGDRLARLEPETEAHLAQAETYFQSALEKGKHLASAADVIFIAQRRIEGNQQRRAQVTSRSRERLAQQTLERIFDELTLNTWQSARSRLMTHEALLTGSLGGAEKKRVDSLLAFFADIDAGEALAGSADVSAARLTQAAEFYGRARNKASAVPAASAVLAAVAEEKVRAVRSRIATLETRDRQAQAREVFDQIVAGLTPTGWTDARRQLLARKDLLLTALDPPQGATAEGLLDFFSDIDAGDSLSRMPSVTAEQMTRVGDFYQRAKQTARKLAPTVDVAFIADIKIAEGQRIVAAIEGRTQAAAAGQLFARIKAGLTLEGWSEARQLLLDNRQFLLTHLESPDSARIGALIDFFVSIDAGDRFTAIDPTTPALLEKAQAAYTEAEAKAGAMAGPPSVGFIAQLKQEQIARRQATLQAAARAEEARQTYRTLLADLTLIRWPEARRRLMDRREALLGQLPRPQQEIVSALLRFFADLDSGDRVMARSVADPAGLAMAREFYEKAGKTAEKLSGLKGLGDIVRQKVMENQGRMAALKEKDLQAAAEQALARIRNDMTPALWMEARKRLTENRRLMEAHLQPEDRKTLAGLIRFFADIDAGDSLASLSSVTEAQMAQAIGFYENARNTAQGLAPEFRVGFIADLRINRGRGRAAEIERQNRQEAARQTLARVISGMTPQGWSQAQERLMDHREDLLAQAAPADRETVQRLLAFFSDIDAGDGFAAAPTATLTDLQQARTFFDQADAKAATLGEAVSVGFITARRKQEIDKRIAGLQAENRAAEARQVFDSALAALTPERWHQAREALDGYRELLQTHLTGQALSRFDRLQAVFADLARGDEILTATAPSAAMMESALSSYRSAATQAESLADAADLSFLIQPKIESLLRKKDALAARHSRAEAEESYGRIIDGLTPSGWKSARLRMAELGPELRKALDPPQQEMLAALERFFSEIDEGDRLAGIRPATRASLENAAMFYDRAEEKAAALPPPMDVGFLAKMRRNEIQGQIAAQEAYERRLAEEKAREPKKPVRPRPSTDKEAIRYAMKDFSQGDYSMALRGFLQAYHKPIAMIRSGGVKRLQGVMGVPDKYRAEIVFLVEIDALLAKSDTLDELAMEDAVQALSGRILDGRGMWGIIPQDRRDKMANRLEKISFSTGESE